MQANAPALMFVELPTINGDISIEASKIIGIRQDNRSTRHAWIDTAREAAYSITFPADHELETEDARHEILWIMHSSLLRAITVQLGDHRDVDPVDLPEMDLPGTWSRSDFL